MRLQNVHSRRQWGRAGSCGRWQPLPSLGPTRPRLSTLRTSGGTTAPPRAATNHSAAATAAAAASLPPRVCNLRPIQAQPTELTPLGFVPNTATLNAVPVELVPLLEAVVAACRTQLGSRLLGVYLRGSLVQPGCFLPGVSDADFLTLCLPHSSSSGNAGNSSSSSNSSSNSSSRSSSAPEAKALRQIAEQLQQEFPQCTKVELREVELPPGSALLPWARLWLERQDSERKPEQERGLHGAAVPAIEAASIPPSALADQQALAFQLKTQAVCLWGWDMPALLPDVAAIPSFHLLPQLVDDVVEALQHSQQQQALAAAAEKSSQALAAPTASAARAVRWALKRCLRAALELCLHGEGRVGGTSVGVCNDSALPPQQQQQAQQQQRSQAQQQQQGRPRYYSRDLWWCAELASLQHPQLRQQLTAALELYMALADTASSSRGSTSSSAESSISCSTGPPPVEQQQLQRHEHEQQPLYALLEEAQVAAAELAAQLDHIYLQQMLAEEPGWLTHHHASSSGSPALPRKGDSSSWRSNSSESSGSSSSSRKGSSSSWWQRLRVRMWAAVTGSSSSSSSMEGGLLGGPPPPVAAPVCGPVLTLDWEQPAARQQAADIINAAAAADILGAPAASSSGAGPASAQLLPSCSQPVLLKGAALHWAAVERWNLGHLASSGLEGRARLAPSLQFPFTEPRLASILAEQQGVEALPSCLASMDVEEFAARMQGGNPCGLPPLVYARGQGQAAAAPGPAQATSACAAGWGVEYSYFQAELPPGLLADCDLSSPPFAVPPEGLGSGGREGQRRLLRQTQAARVWVGPQGAVSPTHYDLSHSFLTQVRGRKRMLFWSPDQLAYLYFYPDTHMLRRRSQVNMHCPQAGCFPLFARAVAQEALLEPGDVVFFPSRWAHYTESLDFSISVTCRFAGAA